MRGINRVTANGKMWALPVSGGNAHQTNRIRMTYMPNPNTNRPLILNRPYSRAWISVESGNGFNEDDFLEGREKRERKNAGTSGIRTAVAVYRTLEKSASESANGNLCVIIRITIRVYLAVNSVIPIQKISSVLNT